MCWYGNVLRREDGGGVSNGALEFEHQNKKWRLRGTWKEQVGEERMIVGLIREDDVCRL